MLWSYFNKGGLIMYPILICSVLALMIIIERLIYIGKVNSEAEGIFSKTIENIKSGNIDAALKECEKNKSSIAGNIIRAGILNINKPREQIIEAIDDAGNRELPKIERFLPILGTIAAIAPMLGLLGTVIGMIESADVLARLGTSSPAKLLAGISSALLTTAFGLIVAIPVLIVYNYLIHKSQNTILAISEKSDKIVNLLVENKKNDNKQPEVVKAN